MRNFTGEPLLSGMITFGIQGVMLIVAWLIGESFATGMNAQPQRGATRFVNPPGPDLDLAPSSALLLFAVRHDALHAVDRNGRRAPSDD
jgi:hypothetical protein